MHFTLLSLPNRIASRLCILTAAIAVAGCGHAPESSQSDTSPVNPPVIEAATMTVIPQLWPRQVTVQGSLIADEVAVVGAKVAGRVDSVQVDLGDRVKAGEPLVNLEQSEFQLQIAHAEAELAQSRAAVGLKVNQPVESLDPRSSPPVREQKASWDEARTKSLRIKQLYQKKAVTENDLETAVATEEVASARYASALNSVNEKLALIGVRAASLELARQHLQDAVIKAPFDCLVQEKHVAPGNYVQVGQQLVTVVRADPLRFRGTIPERYAQSIQRGQTLRLQIDATGKRREVKITRISPSLDLRSRALAFEAKIQNADGKLRDGLFTEGEVVLDPDAKQLSIPKSAVVEFAGIEKVWKVVDGIAQEQVIETGERRHDGVEVLSGLKSGDVILIEGSQGQVAQVKPLETSGAKTSDVQAMSDEQASVADAQIHLPAQSATERFPQSATNSRAATE